MEWLDGFTFEPATTREERLGAWAFLEFLRCSMFMSYEARPTLHEIAERVGVVVVVTRDR